MRCIKYQTFADFHAKKLCDRVLFLFSNSPFRLILFCINITVASGSFVYDIDLGGHKWSPTKEELMVISAKIHKLAEEEIPFERLVVDISLAQDMFNDNEHKRKQIPNIAKKSPSGNIFFFSIRINI